MQSNENIRGHAISLYATVLSIFMSWDYSNIKAYFFSENFYFFLQIDGSLIWIQAMMMMMIKHTNSEFYVELLHAHIMK